ncbi:SLIT-ROBO Rho GTPase-activating protein 1-like isoform X2 [Dreissena polymorpha]|uniref:SLIT-ROBO Rho GTPase-activating protein 1-like isoform X2 n=1 Tax=Dreissena polymorpha TaxID=45954 RepID=UPI002264A680|nr:SLIT-ROBO Rho GTPase-activating protein 1-like isoform X2 [Dreissena polymorpha]
METLLKSSKMDSKKKSRYFDIRQQLGEQLKCLEGRLETQCAMVQEIQDFYRRKAELEMEYSRNLDKLVKSTWSRHKQEKQRRENWDKFSTFNCWSQLLEITRRQSHDHGILAEICGTHVYNRLADIQENSQRLFKKCKDIGSTSHEDILKILYELQKAMKTYHSYQQESKSAEEALKKVQSQKAKVEQQLSGKSLSTSRKFKKIEKQEDERQEKYSVNKLKALHARNEYLLNIEVANAAINKYFSDDVSDLMDCMDFGYHNSISGTVMIYQTAHCNMRNSHLSSIELLNDLISQMDPQNDKQRFLELNNQAFMLPKKFEFQPYKGDEMRQISAQRPVQDQLIQSFKSSQSVLEKLKLENDETWKSLEATEKSLTELINRKDVDVTSLFMEENTPPRSPHESDKKKAQRLETERYYLEKFESYTLSNNRISRLQAKFNAIKKALGEDTVSTTGQRVRQTSNSSMTSLEKLNGSEQLVFLELSSRIGGLHHRPPSLPPKPKKRRIGRNPQVGQPKLFGGNLEEYIEATSQEIPTVIKSCIRVLNLYGMHHQGIFRIPGSQVEINDLKNAFEKGDDPLADEEDACDKINSAAGVLKMFFRELKPPLFPLPLFDELINCSRLDEQAKIDKIKELLLTLPRTIIVVMRYLFAFLNHLSEYSDENMMDPYNLAICFGPTLIPIPPDRDQVTFQSNVNEVIKTIIRNQDEIFPVEGGELYEKCIVDMGQDSLDGMEDEGDSTIPSDDDEAKRKKYYASCISLSDTEVYEATALYDFKGRTEKELSFKKGDNLVLYTKASAEWWEGAFAGKEGLIPSNYVAIKHQPEPKKSVASEDSRSTSSSSLSLASKTSENSHSKAPSVSSSKMLESDILEHEVVMRKNVAETVIVGHVSLPTSGPTNLMSQSMFTDSRLGDSKLSVKSDEGPRFHLGPGVELLKRQNSSPERSESDRLSASDEIASMDSVLAEIMSDVRSLELQQSTERRKSLPLNKSKTSAKHTPDLVLDLPEGSNSPTSQDGSDRDSPTLSAAETFAKSNQGTLKKASSMPRNVPATTDMFTEITVQQKSNSLNKTEPMLSTFHSYKRLEETSKSSSSSSSSVRKFSLDEQHSKSSSTSMQSQQTSTFVPPIVEKPRPPIKVKPPVMKKPSSRSPEVARKLETDLDDVQHKSTSPSSFK